MPIGRRWPMQPDLTLSMVMDGEDTGSKNFFSLTLKVNCQRLVRSIFLNEQDRRTNVESRRHRYMAFL